MQSVPDPTIIDVSRRQLLASTGSLIALGSDVAYVGTQTRPVSAATDVRELDIPDVSKSNNDGHPDAVTCQVSGSYQFSVGTADQLRFRLSAAPAPDSDDWGVLDETIHDASGRRGQGEYSLAGSLLAHDGMDAEMFSADAEETVTHDLSVKVVFDVLAGGESVVTALAQTTAVVEVTNTSVDATAVLTGEGTIGIEF